MLSVYCSGAIVLAWRRFHFAGLWRPVFAFMIVAVLFLNVDSVAIQVFNHFPSGNGGNGIRFALYDRAILPCFSLCRAGSAVSKVTHSGHTDLIAHPFGGLTQNERRTTRAACTGNLSLPPWLGLCPAGVRSGFRSGRHCACRACFASFDNANWSACSLLTESTICTPRSFGTSELLQKWRR